MTQPAPPPEAILLQLVIGRWVSQSVTVAARLNIAELVASGPRTAADLAAATKTQPEALYRILRALASVGVFVETAPKTFANTPISEALRPSAPNSMRNMALMLNDPWQLDNWSHLAECVATGKSAPELQNADLFAAIGADPAALATFQGAMSDMSRGASAAVLSAYDFAGIGTLADVAGGHGTLLSEFMRATPGMKGMLYERPEVIRGAKDGPYLNGLESRMTLAAGDFFESVPAGADAYMMKHILHDWSDELSLKILRNIRKVIPTAGRLILVEAVVPEGNEPHPGKWVDLEMLVNPGGKERTAAEWTKLLADGGFRLTRIVSTPSLFSVVEGVPA